MLKHAELRAPRTSLCPRPFLVFRKVELRSAWLSVGKRWDERRGLPQVVAVSTMSAVPTCGCGAPLMCGIAATTTATPKRSDCSTMLVDMCRFEIGVNIVSGNDRRQDDARE